MLTYQLSSFVNNPPTKCALTVTVFYANEDVKTQAVIDFYRKQCVKMLLGTFKHFPKVNFLDVE